MGRGGGATYWYTDYIWQILWISLQGMELRLSEKEMHH